MPNYYSVEMLATSAERACNCTSQDRYMTQDEVYCTSQSS